MTRSSQSPYKWNPVTRATLEHATYNELKIEEREEREREREEGGAESAEFPGVIKGTRSCLATTQTNDVDEI